MTASHAQDAKGWLQVIISSYKGVNQVTSHRGTESPIRKGVYHGNKIYEALYIHAPYLGCKQHGWDMADHGSTVHTKSTEKAGNEGSDGKN